MFRKLSSYDEALKALERFFPSSPVGVEEVSISDACGRVSAEDVKSPISIPPFDRAIVDGYAVKASDVYYAEEDRPAVLKTLGSVKVGEEPKISVSKGCAVEVMTGAQMPKGADAAVMVEYTERRGEDLLVYRSVTAGENVMKKGSDIEVGETLVKRGTLLSPFEVGMLAAVGLKTVKVYKKPRIAIISTGPELVSPGEKLPPGKIYDINSYTLESSVKLCGGDVKYLCRVEDDTEAIRNSLLRAIHEADLIVTSGGVSVGPYDLIPKILNELGKPGVILSGIAIKPGKPTTFALLDDKPVFALPGQPTSALLTFYLFVRPVIMRMAGMKATPLKRVRAVVDRRIFPAKGRRTFVTVTLRRERGRLVASPVPKGLSGAIKTLAKADGFIEILENQQFIDEGEETTVYLMKSLDEMEVQT